MESMRRKVEEEEDWFLFGGERERETRELNNT